MQAQTYLDQASPDTALEQYRPDPLQQQVPAEQAVAPVTEEPAVTDETPQTDGQEDLSEYVFKFLEEKGYPPRRLEEFEDNFVQEKIFAGNNREVTIVLPDRYYGTKKRFSDKDVNKFVRTISERFQLSFIDGERKDKKFTINFSSVAPQQDGEGLEPKDDLDVIFGTPKGKGKEKSEVKPAAKPAVAKQKPVQ